MPRLTAAEWIGHLRSTALCPPVPASLGLGDMEPAFRSFALGEPLTPPSTPIERAEAGLWWALVDQRVRVEEVLAEAPAGPLFEQSRYRSLEVWTEAELSGLHALWHLAHRSGSARWRERVEQVRNWHLIHTQPDNATNRPWSLHVFVEGGSAESHLYAETLLHNCLAIEGRPEPLSALILRDAARALEWVSG